MTKEYVISVRLPTARKKLIYRITERCTTSQSLEQRRWAYYVAPGITRLQWQLSCQGQTWQKVVCHTRCERLEIEVRRIWNVALTAVFIACADGYALHNLCQHTVFNHLEDPEAYSFVKPDK